MDSALQAPRRLGRRPALDGLRAIAVALVIGIHVGLLTAGYIGVDVFLPLSGFLITALLCEEWERTGRIDLRRFSVRRGRRLLPALVILLAVYAAVMLVLDPFHGQWSTGALTASTLLFANNWVASLAPQHGAALGALSPTWSLGEEAQFYLLWPLALWLALRLRPRPGVMLAALAVGVLALLGAAPLLGDLVAHYNAYTNPLDRGAELLAGAAAAIAWRHGLVPAPLRWPATGVLLAAGLAALVVAGVPSLPRWYLTAAALSALLIVNLLSQAERPRGDRRWWRRLPAAGRGVLPRALAWRPLTFTGQVSYGIYLFHVPIYYLIWTYAPRLSPLAYWPVVFAASLLAAAASWRLVEAPILRGAGGGLRRRREDPTSSALDEPHGDHRDRRGPQRAGRGDLPGPRRVSGHRARAGAASRRRGAQRAADPAGLRARHVLGRAPGGRGIARVRRDAAEPAWAGVGAPGGGHGPSASGRVGRGPVL